MSRIELNFVATGDFKAVQSQISTLRATVQQLNREMGAVGFDSGRISQIRSAVAEYDRIVQSTGAFTRQTVQLDDATTRFGRNLEQNKLRLNDYFRVVREGSRATQGELRMLAEQQVKLRNSVIRTDPFNAGKVYVDTPRQIDTIAKSTEIGRTQLGLFNMALRNGAGELINWGKNTQWAGRQLTVGLTVPITMFGKAASDVFMKFDKELTRVAKVYGSGLTAATKEATDAIKTQVSQLSVDLASSLGQSIEVTAGIAAEIAATGMQGNELINATRETTRLATLGEIDRQEAMRATISLQNVFQMSTGQLTESINFLNAVENQTSTSLQDIVTAIPKAAPVIKQLGGNYKDLAVMMVAMREAGVPASEAANAIKSALGSVINPSKKTAEELGKVGINLKGIVDTTQGDPVKTFMELGKELDNLSSLERARAIENIFGKFQFARISALLANLGKQGSQTQQVFELMGASAIQTAQLADAELKAMTESVSGRYQRALASLQASLVPFGEKFTEFATVLLEMFTKVADFINSNEGIKQLVTILAGVTAFIGPVIMLAGVFGNFFGYMFKGIATIKNLGGGFKSFMGIATAETVAAEKAGELFSQGMMNQAEAINTVTMALERLNTQLSGLASRQATPVTALVGGAGGPVARATSQADIMASMSSAIPYAYHSGGYIQGVEKVHYSPASEMPGGRSGELANMASTGFFVGGADPVDDAVARLQQKLGSSHNMTQTLMMTEAELMDKRVDIFTQQMLAAGRQLPEITKYLERPDIENILRKLYQSKEVYRAGSVQYVTALEILSRQISNGDEESKRTFEAIKKGVTSGTMGAQEVASRLRAAAITAVGGPQQFVLALERKMQEISAAAAQGLNPVEVLGGMELKARQGMGSVGKFSGYGYAQAGFYSLETLDIPTQELAQQIRQSAAVVRQTESEYKKLNKELESNSTSLTRAKGYTVQYSETLGKYVVVNKDGVVAESKLSARLKQRLAELNNMRIADEEHRQTVRTLTGVLRSRTAAARAATAADEKLAATTNEAAAATGMETATGAATGGRKGRLGRVLGRMGGGMGLAIGGSMIANQVQSMLSPEQQQGALGKGVGVLGSTAEFAGIGMMFGPWGAAIGAIAGLGKGLVDLVNANNAAKEAFQSGITQSLQVGSVAANHFGVEVATLANVQLSTLVNSSKDAADSVDQLTEAYKNAGDEATKGFLEQVRTADPQDAVKMLVNKYRADLVSGMSDAQAREDIAAILGATGRQNLAFQVGSEVFGMNLKTSTDALVSQIGQERDAVINSAQYQELQAFIADPTGYMISHDPQGIYATGDEEKRYQLTLNTYNNLVSQLSAVKDQFDNVASSMMNAFSTAPIESFGATSDEVFGKTYWDDMGDGAEIAKQEFVSLTEQVGKVAPALGTAMDELKGQGVSLSTISQAAGLALRGVIKDVYEFRLAAEYPVYLDFVIRRYEQNQAAAAVVEEATARNQTLAQDLAAGIPQGGTGGSGGSSGGGSSGGGSSAQFNSKPYDRAIEAQRSIIDGINAERQARQKLAEQQKSNEQFLINEMNLKNQMAESLAKGDFMAYYQSQVELGQLQQNKIREDEEKRKQAEEDRRIKAAEAEIKAIEKRKQAAQEAFNAANRGGGAGGGGGGGTSAAATSGGARATAEQIQSVLDSVVGGTEITQAFADKAAFIQSKAFKDAVKQLTDLGVSHKDAVAAIEQQYDALEAKVTTVGQSFINRVREEEGVPARIAEQSQAFITNFDEMTTEAFKKISPDQASKLKVAFLNALNSGVDPKVALRDLSVGLANAVGENGAYKGLTPEEATKKAQGVVTSLQAKFKADHPQIFADVTNVLVPKGPITYDADGNPKFSGTFTYVSGMADRDLAAWKREKGYAYGGYISGPGGPKDDVIPALLSNGEYVINADSVKHYGKTVMDSINQKKASKTSQLLDGIRSRTPGFTEPVMTFANGGPVRPPSKWIPDARTATVEALARKYANNTPYSSTVTAPGKGWGCMTSIMWLYANGANTKLPTGGMSNDLLNSSLPNVPSLSGAIPGDVVLYHNPRGVNLDIVGPNGANHAEMILSGGEVFNGGVSIRGGVAGYPIVGIKRPLKAGAKFSQIDTKGTTEFSKMMVPQYHNGGMVQYSKGGEVMAMLQGGEVVVPTNTVDRVNPLLDALTSGKIGMGEINNNITINGANQSPKEIAKVVVREIENSMKRNVSVNRVI